MEVIIIGIILLIWPIIVLAKKSEFSKLSLEDKQLYDDAVYKIQDIDKNSKKFRIIGTIIIIALVIITPIILTICVPKVEVSTSSYEGIMAVRSRMDKILTIDFTIFKFSVIAYFIARILFEIFYIRKGIKNSKVLSEKEKALLNTYYSKSLYRYVANCFIIQLGIALIDLIFFTTADKPIIYIYPDEKKKVTVRVGNPENLIHTYPEYNEGWEVEADVDGTLTDANGKKYYSLYWEGINKVKVDEKIGFCVKGEDTAKFLEEKLEALGLNFKEREEFIVYWLPKMENNRYNYVYFMQTNETDTVMPLEINPKPETLIRVLMYYKPLLLETSPKEQVFKPVERTGYTVVEWGGTKI